MVGSSISDSEDSEIRVLLVDDESDFLEQEKMYLERENDRFNLKTTESPKEALEILEDLDFDCIVSDYQMPGIDGLELFQKVKEKEINIPFIIFTGRGREEVAIDALNLGADRYLQKGGDPESQFKILSDAIIQEYASWRSRKEKRKIEETHQEVFDKISDAILIHDKDTGEIIDVNKAACDMYGYSKEEFIALDLENIVSDNSPDMKRKAHRMLEKTKDEGSQSFMSKDEKKDGTKFWVEVNLSLAEIRGEERILSAVRNITEREEAKKLAEIAQKSVDNTSISVFWTAPDGEFVYVNDKAAKKLGYEKEELVGMKSWEIDENLTKEKRKDLWDRIQSEKNLEIETEVVRKNGETFPVQINLDYIQFGDKEFSFAFMKDISERKKRQKRIENLNKLLRSVREINRLITKENDVDKLLKKACKILVNHRDYLEASVIMIDSENGQLNPIAQSGMDKDYYQVLNEMNKIPGCIKEIMNQKETIFVDEPQNYCEVCQAKDDEDFSHQTILSPLIQSESLTGILSVCRRPDPIIVEKEKQLIDGIASDLAFAQEKIKADRELREERRKYRSLFENSPIPIWEQDLSNLKSYLDDLKDEVDDLESYFNENSEEVMNCMNKVQIKDVNQKALEYYEAESKKSLFENMDKIMPDEAKKTLKDEFIAISNHNTHFKSETVSRTLDGEEKDEILEIRIPDEYSDDFSRAYVIVTEISEQKEIEKKVQKLHDVAAEMESAKTEKEVCQLAVDAAEEILEFEVCGIDLVEDQMFVPKAMSSDVGEDGFISRPVDEGGLSKKTFRGGESLLVEDLRSNDDAKPVKGQYRAAISVPIGGLGIFQAISTEVGGYDRNDLEMAELLASHVNEALKRLKYQEREQFLHSLLRHDLRNKSQTVLGYLELLSNMDLSDDQEDLLNKAISSSKEGIDLIEKIRDLNKVKSQESRDVELKQYLEEAMKNNEGIADRGNIKISTDIKEFIVEGGKLLEELFSNLIENSIRHSNCERINIKTEEVQDKVKISIIDDGEGITDNEKEKIFEKGYKGRNSPGSGLGMYLVKKIVENYDGDIELEDSEAGGTQINVRLNRVEPN